MSPSDASALIWEIVAAVVVLAIFYKLFFQDPL